MDLVQVRKKGQITLPLSVRRALHVDEGDVIAVEVRNGEIVLRPKKLIDADQAWFWSERWQEAEREATADIRAGRVHEFANAEEAIDFLHRRAKQRRTAP
jgi:AbrB family looped-hinge helix DNA binding protein